MCSKEQIWLKSMKRIRSAFFEYVDFVITCLEHLPPSMVVHRLTGDGPKKLLLAPAWSADKKRVLNAFTRRFCERGTWQGKYFTI